MEETLLIINDEIYIKTESDSDSLAKLKYLVNKIVKKNKYTTHLVKINNISTLGCNFFAQLYEVNIEGLTDNGDEELNLFAKVKAINYGAEIDKVISIPKIYKTERFAYVELSKMFEELQEKANIPSHDRFIMAKSYMDNTTDVILLDNLKRKGYEVCNVLDVISLNYAEKAVKEMAKLHGISFALQKEKPNYLNEKLNILKHPYTLDKIWPEIMTNTRNVALEFADDDIKEKIKAVYFDATITKLKDYLGDESIQYCLCHGDYKLQNIMMIIQNQEILDMVLVDYQFLHFGCPVFDFIFFIFLSTDREFRKQHLEHLKEFYYKSLRNYLEYFDIDVETVFPKMEFEKIYKEKLDFGLFVGFVGLQFAMVAEVPDSNYTNGTRLEINSRYRDRLQGMIEDFVEWEYI